MPRKLFSLALFFLPLAVVVPGNLPDESRCPLNADRLAVEVIDGGENEDCPEPGAPDSDPSSPVAPPETPPPVTPEPPAPEDQQPDEPERPNKPNKPQKPNKPNKPNKPINNQQPSGGVSPDDSRPKPSGPSGGVSPGQLPPAGPEVVAKSSSGSFALSPGVFDAPTLSAQGALSAFDIPPFLLPIYQACGAQYQIPWEILASINKIETGFGRLYDLTSSAGAQGWMQFMPATWEAYGTDANGDGQRDPRNPVDAICAAARYLQASGYQDDPYQAIWAYNHADWYVNDVQQGAEQYYALPTNFTAALSQLIANTQAPAGRSWPQQTTVFPALARWQEKPTTTTGHKRSAENRPQRPAARGLALPAAETVRSTQELRVLRVGRSENWGRYLLLADRADNQYLYGRLARAFSAKKLQAAAAKVQDAQQGKRPAPTGAERQRQQRTMAGKSAPQPIIASPQRIISSAEQRLNAQPEAENKPLWLPAGQALGATLPATAEQGASGSRVSSRSFWALRPAGVSGPRWLDPQDLRVHWAALRASGYQRLPARWRRQQAEPLFAAQTPGQLAQRVLDDSNIELSSCDRQYIAAGVIDPRVLAALVAFSARGYQLLISSMYCGRESSITTSGNISNHSRAAAIDIAAINGQTISTATQGLGSLTDQLARQALAWPAELAPSEVISLLDYPQAAGFAMSDHDDHLHLGWSSSAQPGALALRAAKIDWSAWQWLDKSAKPRFGAPYRQRQQGARSSAADARAKSSAAGETGKSAASSR